jgi:hypothetical protein
LFSTLVENLTPQNKTLLLYLTISYHLLNKKPGEEEFILSGKEKIRKYDLQEGCNVYRQLCILTICSDFER